MRPFNDVLKLMKEKGFSDKQMQEASKQFMKAVGTEHTEKKDTVSATAKQVTKYMSDVFTGDVAKKGLQRMGKDLDNFTSNPEVAFDYLGGAGVGWISKVKAANSFKIDLGGDTRYFDLDIVDDLAKSGGRYTPRLFGGDQTPSLKKHLLGEEVKIARVSNMPSNVEGLYRAKDNLVGLSKKEAEVAKGNKVSNPAYAVAHETQHAINNAQKLPKGSSPAQVLKAVKENRPEALEGLTERQIQIKAHNTYTHTRGEVDANLTQAYHKRIIQELDAGKDPEVVKKIIKNIDPKRLLEQSYGKLGFRENRIKNWPPRTPETNK